MKAIVKSLVLTIFLCLNGSNVFCSSIEEEEQVSCPTFHNALVKSYNNMKSLMEENSSRPKKENVRALLYNSTSVKGKGEFGYYLAHYSVGIEGGQKQQYFIWRIDTDENERHHINMSCGAANQRRRYAYNFPAGQHEFLGYLRNISNMLENDGPQRLIQFLEERSSS
jgi:hypothetical protein